MEFSISIPQVLVEPQFGRQLFAFLNAAGNLRYLIVQKLLRQNQLNCPTKSHKCIQHTTQQAPQISQPELHITLEQFEGEFLHLGAANSYSIFVNIRQNSWKKFARICLPMLTNVHECNFLWRTNTSYASSNIHRIRFIKSLFLLSTRLMNSILAIWNRKLAAVSHCNPSLMYETHSNYKVLTLNAN